MSSARTEQASPRKLAAARARGEVALSRVLLAAAGLSAICALALAGGEVALRAIRSALLAALQGEGAQRVGTAQAGPDAALATAGQLAASVLAPVGVAVVAAVALAGIAQTGGLWSTRVLLPDARRSSPMERFAALWSGERAADAVAIALRVFVLLAVLVSVLAPNVRGMLALPASSASRATPQLGALASALAVRVAVAAVVLGLADAVYQRVLHALRMKMTRHELLEELRQTEGDPQLRSERARRQRERAQS